MKMIVRRVIALVLLCLMLPGAVMLAHASDEATPEAGHAGVVRDVVNEGDPESAPGEVLQLVRYTIPPNIKLPAHVHPGMQVNVVESGTLNYTVVEGSMEITRADGTGEVLTSGQSTTFEAGDRFTEPEGMVHFGENRTDEPIVLLTASLFEDDEPPSTVVEVTPVATPAA